VPDLPFKTGAQIALSVSRSAVFASSGKAFAMPELPPALLRLALAAQSHDFRTTRPVKNNQRRRFGLNWR
jgi:hypothetical protein